MVLSLRARRMSLLEMLRCTAGQALQGSSSVTHVKTLQAQITRDERTLAEDVEGKLDDEQEDTASGSESEHLWHEALVQRRRALFPEDRDQTVCEGGRCQFESRVKESGPYGLRRVRPVVLRNDAGDLARALYARLHDVKPGTSS